MSNCGNKIKQTCGASTYASCVETEITPNIQSEIFEQDCLDVETVLQDVYDQIGEIKEEIDLEALGNECLEYTLEEGKIIVKNVLAKFEEIICEQQEQIEALQNTAICNTSITDCDLDWGDLVTQCGDTPSTLAEALQVIINKLNE